MLETSMQEKKQHEKLVGDDYKSMKTPLNISPDDIHLKNLRT